MGTPYKMNKYYETFASVSDLQNNRSRNICKNLIEKNKHLSLKFKRLDRAQQYI